MGREWTWMKQRGRGEKGLFLHNTLLLILLRSTYTRYRHTDIVLYSRVRTFYILHVWEVRNLIFELVVDSDSDFLCSRLLLRVEYWAIVSLILLLIPFLRHFLSSFLSLRIGKGWRMQRTGTQVQWKSKIYKGCSPSQIHGVERERVKNKVRVTEEKEEYTRENQERRFQVCA